MNVETNASTASKGPAIGTSPDARHVTTHPLRRDRIRLPEASDFFLGDEDGNGSPTIPDQVGPSMKPTPTIGRIPMIDADPEALRKHWEEQMAYREGAE